jgi:hypothetical protein
MKMTIVLKEFSASPSGAVEIRHAPASADSTPQPTSGSVNGFHVPPDKSGEGLRDVPREPHATPFPCGSPYQRGGIYE